MLISGAASSQRTTLPRHRNTSERRVGPRGCTPALPHPPAAHPRDAWQATLPCPPPLSGRGMVRNPISGASWCMPAALLRSAFSENWCKMAHGRMTGPLFSAEYGERWDVSAGLIQTLCAHRGARWGMPARSVRRFHSSVPASPRTLVPAGAGGHRVSQAFCRASGGCPSPLLPPAFSQLSAPDWRLALRPAHPRPTPRHLLISPASRRSYHSVAYSLLSHERRRNAADEASGPPRHWRTPRLIASPPHEECAGYEPIRFI